MAKHGNCCERRGFRAARRARLDGSEPLHRALLDRVRTGDPLNVTGATVERVSTAVIQVLLAAATEARSRGNSFLLRDASPVLTDALVDLGVASHLGF